MLDNKKEWQRLLCPMEAIILPFSIIFPVIVLILSIGFLSSNIKSTYAAIFSSILCISLLWIVSLVAIFFSPTYASVSDRGVSIKKRVGKEKLIRWDQIYKVGLKNSLGTESILCFYKEGRKKNVTGFWNSEIRRKIEKIYSGPIVRGKLHTEGGVEKYK